MMKKKPGRWTLNCIANDFFVKYDFMYMLIISDGENNDKRIHLGGIIVRDGYAIKLINHNYFTGQKSFSQNFFFHFYEQQRKK